MILLLLLLLFCYYLIFFVDYFQGEECNFKEDFHFKGATSRYILNRFST